MADLIRKITNWFWNTIPSLVTTLFFLWLFIYADRMYFWLGILIVTAYFVYRIYFSPFDIMYIGREELETTMFGKPFRFYKPEEKIKMKKFVWRKSK